jgi:hypothetical protein
MFKVAAGWGKLHEVNKRRKGEEESERVTRERDLGKYGGWKEKERKKEGRKEEGERETCLGRSVQTGWC